MVSLFDWQIYSVSVDSDFGHSKPSKTADLEGEISIGFSCDPNVSATLVSSSSNIIPIDRPL